MSDSLVIALAIYFCCWGVAGVISALTGWDMVTIVVYLYAGVIGYLCAEAYE